MPQLSPLNWIFLFFLAWASIFVVFSVVWWMNKISFSAQKDDDEPMKRESVPGNNWSW